MILKLRNGKITIEDNSVPELTRNVCIAYDYELGTNHYTTLLHANNITHVGPVANVALDFETPIINLKVELLDTHNRVVKTYTGSFKYIKMCLIGTSELVNVYKKLQELQEENTRLKEKGEVI